MIVRIRPKPRRDLPPIWPREEYLRPAPAVTPPFEVGRVIGAGQKFSLTDAQTAVHVAVLGTPGSGKSKFLHLMMQQRIEHGKGFALWDPHGDLAKALLADVAAKKAYGDDETWRKVHYLELTPECIFSFDPVANAPRRTDVGDYAYYQWLRVRIGRVWKVLMRRVSEANQVIMVRLKRWLVCVLYACLVAIDDKNTHAGLDKALVFTDPTCDEFKSLYPKVAPHLPPRVRRNFEKLIETKRAQDQEKWVESTINKLEEALSPLTEAVYSQQKPSIDIKGIIDRGEFLLIDLKETDWLSAEEKVVLGGLLLTEVLSVKQSEELPEDQRKEFMIVVDEVGELLGDDLKRALGATRKFKCPIVLGGQDLSTFAMGDFDMAAKVLTMCGTVVCFQNTYLEDKKFLADRVFCGNLDLFTKRMIEVQRQRGDRILRYDEISENFSASRSRSKTHTEGENETHAKQISNAIGIASNESETKSDGRGLGHRKSDSAREHDTETLNKANSATKGKALNETNSTATSDATGRNSSDAETEGEGAQAGVTIAHKVIIQPNTVSEFDDSGTLEKGPVDVQRAQHEQLIHTLGIGQAAVAVRGIREAFVVQVMAVEEYFTDGTKKYEAIERIKKRLHALHSYFFTPSRTSMVGPKQQVLPVTNGRKGKPGGKPPQPKIIPIPD